MMMNSNSNTTLSLYLKEDHALFMRADKLAFADNTTISTRKLDMRVFSELSEIVEQDDLLELCDLKYVQEYMITDVSSDETLSLCLRVPVSQSYRKEYKSIDCKAVRQNGKEDRLSRLLSRLQTCGIEGTALETKVLKSQTGMGMGMGMGEFATMMMQGTGDPNPLAVSGAPEPSAAQAAVSGDWICPNCGYKDNTGRFCRECGSPRA